MNSGNLTLITGSSSGIGEAIARRLTTSGQRVFLTGRDSERLQKLQSELPGSFAEVCDLENPSAIDALAERVRGTLQGHHLRLAGLVNNAGMFFRKSVIETSAADWHRMFAVNFFSAVQLSQALFPELQRSTPASVLNIASTLGLRSVPTTAAYAASKAAMVSWTETLALEWAPHRVRVNCICPGIVDTPIHPFHTLPDGSSERQSMHEMQPLARMGQPKDIADAAEFLLSERSSWTTGSVLRVDGGIFLQ